MPKLPFVLVPAMYVSLLSLAPTAAGAQAVKSSQPATVSMDQAIHDYILAHPEVMLQSIRSFDLHRKAVEQEQAKTKVRANLSALQSGSPASAAAASAAASVTIVEFFDYRCGFCKKVQPTVTELAQRPGVRIVYKDLPILGPDSVLAAKAALAADKQGGYAKLHDLLIGAAAPLTAESIAGLATQAGLDASRLKKDMDSPEVSAAIARNLALAETLSVQATPTFVVGDQMVSGALTPEAFDGLIKAAQPVAAVASAAH